MNNNTNKGALQSSFPDGLRCSLYLCYTNGIIAKYAYAYIISIGEDRKWNSGEKMKTNEAKFVKTKVKNVLQHPYTPI